MEYYGDPVGDVDPLEDMNWIVRVARTHARRVQLDEMAALKSAADG